MKSLINFFLALVNLLVAAILTISRQSTKGGSKSEQLPQTFFFFSKEEERACVECSKAWRGNYSRRTSSSPSPVITWIVNDDFMLESQIII